MSREAARRKREWAVRYDGSPLASLDHYTVAAVRASEESSPTMAGA
jgi:hypothetical protein